MSRSGRPAPSYRNAGSGWHGHYRNLAGLEVIGTMAAVPGAAWIAVTELPADEEPLPSAVKPWS